MSYGQPTYAGGLAQNAAVSDPRLDDVLRDNEALRREIAALWQNMSTLHERAPSSPGPAQTANAARAAVDALAKRLDEIEARMPRTIKTAADSATKLAVDAVGHVYGPMIADLRDDLDKLLQTADKLARDIEAQGRSLDDAVRANVKRHADLMALSAWQLDCACNLLRTEAREHVREH